MNNHPSTTAPRQTSGLGRESDKESRLAFALLISFGIMLLEIIGSRLSNSLALLGDAGHVFSDIFALGLSILAVRLSRRPHTGSMTYGFHRLEILIAFLNAGSLITVSLYLLYEAFLRFLHPPEVKAPILLVVASIGLLGNVASARLMWPQRRRDLNVRTAFLHILGDTLASIGTVVGGVSLLLTGVSVIDPLVGALIGGLILKASVGVSRESAMILLEAVPKQIRLEQVAQALDKIEGVKGVHELHVWTITSGFYALTGHITIEDQMLSQAEQILNSASQVLRERFSITHVTLQPETDRTISLSTVKKHGPS